MPSRCNMAPSASPVKPMPISDRNVRRDAALEEAGLVAGFDFIAELFREENCGQDVREGCWVLSAWKTAYDGDCAVVYVRWTFLSDSQPTRGCSSYMGEHFDYTTKRLLISSFNGKRQASSPDFASACGSPFNENAQHATDATPCEGRATNKTAGR